jgi:hypothetical protein
MPKLGHLFATLQNEQDDRDSAFLVGVCNEVADCVMDTSLAFILGSQMSDRRTMNALCDSFAK